MTALTKKYCFDKKLWNLAKQFASKSKNKYQPLAETKYSFIKRWNQEGDILYGPLVFNDHLNCKKPQLNVSGTEKFNEIPVDYIDRIKTDTCSSEKSNANESINTHVPSEYSSVISVADLFKDDTESCKAPLQTKSYSWPENVSKDSFESYEHKEADHIDNNEKKKYCISATVPLSTDHRANDNVGSLSNILTIPFFSKSVNKPYTVPVNSKVQQYPSVTRILEQTMSSESRMYLERWKKQMIEKLGYEEFIQYQKETLQNGANLHLCIKEFLEGKAEKDLILNAANHGHWKSIKDVLQQVETVHYLETPVVHPILKYKGITDCIAVFRNTLCLIEWKTSKSQKKLLRFTYDNPIQVAAYAGAINWNDNFKLEIENAAIVLAYNDGRPATTHMLTSEQCESYWAEWCNRLHSYWLSYFAESPTSS